MYVGIDRARIIELIYFTDFLSWTRFNVVLARCMNFLVTFIVVHHDTVPFFKLYCMIYLHK